MNVARKSGVTAADVVNALPANAMVAFGAAFGYTVMSRMSLLIGCFDDLILFSGADYGRPTLILLVLTVAILMLWEYRQKNARRSE